MARQPEDSLEKFFVSRVKDYHFDFKEKDWQNLESMLDASEGIKAAIFRQKMVWVGSIALLLVSVGLLIWMSGLLSGEEDLGETSEGQRTEIKADGIVSEPQRAESTFESGTETLDNKVDQTQVDRSNQVDAKSDISGDQETIASELEDTSAVVSDSNQEIVTPTEDQITPSLIETNKVSEPAFTEEVILLIEKDEKKSYKGLTIQKAGMYFDMPDLPAMHLDFEIIEIQPQSEIVKNYAWNFSVAADYSAVGMSDFDGPYLRAGLSFEYYFQPTVSLSVGANYAVKNYQAYGREYSPPYGFWTNGVVPDVTDASCNVLDIPVNLTLYLPNAKKQAFFIRAGLSSWLMLEEHYYYGYESNDPDLISYWGAENENYHYFSIINVAVGFEQPLSNKISVLAEPYFNIPLAGVGAGAVDLYSAGIKFSFKVYSFKLKTINEE